MICSLLKSVLFQFQLHVKKNKMYQEDSEQHYRMILQLFLPVYFTKVLEFVSLLILRSFKT